MNDEVSNTDINAGWDAEDSSVEIWSIFSEVQQKERKELPTNNGSSNLPKISLSSIWLVWWVTSPENQEETSATQHNKDIEWDTVNSISETPLASSTSETPISSTISTLSGESLTSSKEWIISENKTSIPPKVWLQINMWDMASEFQSHQTVKQPDTVTAVANFEQDTSSKNIGNDLDTLSKSHADSLWKDTIVAPNPLNPPQIKKEDISSPDPQVKSGLQIDMGNLQSNFESFWWQNKDIKPEWEKTLGAIIPEKKPEIFKNYESTFQKRRSNIMQQLKKMRQIAKTNFVFIISAIVLTSIWIYWLSYVDPKVHNLNNYKTSVQIWYNKAADNLWLPKIDTTTAPNTQVQPVKKIEEPKQIVIFPTDVQPSETTGVKTGGKHNPYLIPSTKNEKVQITKEVIKSYFSEIK